MHSLSILTHIPNPDASGHHSWKSALTTRSSCFIRWQESKLLIDGFHKTKFTCFSHHTIHRHRFFPQTHAQAVSRDRKWEGVMGRWTAGCHWSRTYWSERVFSSLPHPPFNPYFFFFKTKLRWTTPLLLLLRRQHLIVPDWQSELLR